MDLDELAEMVEDFTGGDVESRADQLEITRDYFEQAFEKIEPSVTKEMHESIRGRSIRSADPTDLARSN